MMLKPIGHIPEKDRDFDPIEVPIIGYFQNEDGTVTEVTEVIKFRPVPPLGYSLGMLNAIDGEGNIASRSALVWVTGCVLESNREKWDTLIDSPDIYIETTTIMEVYTAIGEVYTGRPLKKRSGSKGGRGRTNMTSQAVADEKVTPLKTSA